MRRAVFGIALAVASVLLLPTVAAAEVSDKIPSIGFLWLESLAFAGLAVVLARLRWWLPAVLLPVTLVFVAGSLDQMSDPYLGPAIWAEQGWPYVISLYGSSALFVLAQGAALWFGRGWHRARHAKAAV